MTFEWKVTRTGKAETIDSTELMFRLMGRRNRPMDINILEKGGIVKTDYAEVKKLF